MTEYDDDGWSVGAYKTLLHSYENAGLVTACMGAGILDAGQSVFELTVDGVLHDHNR